MPPASRSISLRSHRSHRRVSSTPSSRRLPRLFTISRRTSRPSTSRRSSRSRCRRSSRRCSPWRPSPALPRCQPPRHSSTSGATSPKKAGLPIISSPSCRLPRSPTWTPSRACCPGAGSRARSPCKRTDRRTTRCPETHGLGCTGAGGTPPIIAAQTHRSAAAGRGRRGERGIRGPGP